MLVKVSLDKGHIFAGAGSGLRLCSSLMAGLRHGRPKGDYQHSCQENIGSLGSKVQERFPNRVHHDYCAVGRLGTLSIN